MVIIPYQKEHKPRLIEIFNLNTPKYFAPEEQADFETYLHENGRNYYVLKSFNEIAGSGGFQFNGHVASISWLMIDPDFKGEGFGMALFNHCLDKLRKKNVSAIEVMASEYAHKFFKKLGFDITEFHENFWNTGVDFFRMKKQL
ncbi:MAG: GNAT family N-acetyltransferase [Fulvivirga sp.]|nr:GNAT family N-acetyltransferase [Fulvivirga sp.]